MLDRDVSLTPHRQNHCSAVCLLCCNCWPHIVLLAAHRRGGCQQSVVSAYSQQCTLQHPADRRPDITLSLCTLACPTKPFRHPTCAPSWPLPQITSKQANCNMAQCTSKSESAQPLHMTDGLDYEIYGIGVAPLHHTRMPAILWCIGLLRSARINSDRAKRAKITPSDPDPNPAFNFAHITRYCHRNT